VISLYQLRTFLEVAATGSVREAAERLVVSQPAVSSALASLHKDLQIPLVERSGRGIVITAAGREVEREGRRLFALLDEMERRASAAAAAASRRIRLAVVTTAAEQLLPPMLMGFRAHHAGLDVVVDVANRSRVWERLEHWEADLAIAGRTPSGRGFRTLATRPNELVVVAPSDLHVDVTALGEATWLLREAGSGTRDATQEFFAQLGISPPRLTIGSNAAIRECVRAGLGLSLLSHAAVAREIEAGTLKIVPTPATPIARAWHLVCNEGRDETEAMRRFVHYAVTEASFVAA
jgi:DNA-binding transcriptional LysR family regulator